MSQQVCIVLFSLCFVLQVISFFYDEFESAIAPPLNSHVLCTIIVTRCKFLSPVFVNINENALTQLLLGRIFGIV